MAQPHILLVTFPAQGHINPALQFAKRLVAIGAHVTFSTSNGAEKNMAKAGSYPPALSFSAFDDGTEHGFRPTDDIDHYMFLLKRCGSQSVAQLIVETAQSGRPFTCVVYSNLIPWVGKVARDLHLPSILLWNQAATVFDLFYYYFKGYGEEISKNMGDESFSLKLPGLSVPFGSQDLPSFFDPANTHTFGMKLMKEQLEVLDQEACTTATTTRPTVLVNTFDPLESEALKSVSRYEMVGVGPSIPSAFLDGKDPSDTSFGGDLFRASKDYRKWLDLQQESSVIYISFGSVSVLSGPEMEEMARALLDAGRPFLWVIRPVNAGSEESTEEDKLSCREELEKQGMIVPWCSQVEVLSHPSLGCFVTHCGWNSSLESMTSGVPVVAFPRWTDQLTNAKMVEEVWKTGVRVTRRRRSTAAESIVAAEEIKRCLEVIMGDGERGEEMRRNAKKWKELARQTSREDGSSYANLKAFVDKIAQAC
ncbi:hypothetical protein Tsubulata_036100 [Turnera subulata]|uniref:Glycosyltransferase n=1 Tax=Turnera subulata TaxID=218843 RepID=A0A9Q0J0J9_9ROSI|nr:hypothetical protein Tsubulata_036100 [Turnera subulata]